MKTHKLFSVREKANLFSVTGSREIKKNVPIRLQTLRVAFKTVIFFTIVTLFSLSAKPFNENSFLQLEAESRNLKSLAILKLI